MMNQTAVFNEALETLKNLRAAAENGDAEAIRILPFFDNASPAALLMDISRFRPKREVKKP